MESVNGLLTELQDIDNKRRRVYVRSSDGTCYTINEVLVDDDGDVVLICEDL
ncbi:MAG: hypothetical protein ABIN91_11170 [Mucilaginibacter sp.]|uniref:hypothetical protein n=1 Tax=Mucilaginibacter sp. TaxID=1882438 RepID=UPI003267DE9A